MPLYSFTNDDETEFVDVFFHMNDKKVYVGPDGKEWRRVYTVPNASVDTVINPFSERDFVEKTGRKAGSIGDLQDRASELSKIRQQKEGIDPVRAKFEKNYKKQTGKDLKLLKKDPVVVKKNGFTVSMKPD